MKYNKNTTDNKVNLAKKETDKSKGYFAFYRDWLHNPIFAGEPDLLVLYICLYSAANHGEREQDGVKTFIGEIKTSPRLIIENNPPLKDVKETTIYKRLQKLEKYGYIEQKKTNKYTIIKVVDYEIEQQNGKNKTEKKGKQKSNLVKTKNENGKNKNSIKTIDNIGENDFSMLNGKNKFAEQSKQNAEMVKTKNENGKTYNNYNNNLDNNLKNNCEKEYVYMVEEDIIIMEKNEIEEKHINEINRIAEQIKMDENLKNQYINHYRNLNWEYKGNPMNIEYHLGNLKSWIIRNENYQSQNNPEQKELTELQKLIKEKINYLVNLINTDDNKKIRYSVSQEKQIKFLIKKFGYNRIKNTFADAGTKGLFSLKSILTAIDDLTGKLTEYEIYIETEYRFNDIEDVTLTKEDFER